VSSLTSSTERMNDYKIYEIIKITRLFCLSDVYYHHRRRRRRICYYYYFFFSRTRQKLLTRLDNHIWVFAISCPLAHLPTISCIVQCCIGVYLKSSVIHSILKGKLGWTCLPEFSKDLTLRNLTHECHRVVSYGIFPSLLTFMPTPRDRTKEDLGN